MKKVVWGFLAVLLIVTFFATKSKTMTTMFKQDASLEKIKTELA